MIGLYPTATLPKDVARIDSLRNGIYLDSSLRYDSFRVSGSWAASVLDESRCR